MNSSLIGDDTMKNRAGKCMAIFSFFIVLGAASFADDATFLKRSLSSIEEKTVDFSTPTAHYKPLFGMGDDNSPIVRGIAYFGKLTVDPGGNSKIVSYPKIEQIVFVLEGTGTLNYEDQKVPIKKNDFMYIPIGVKNGISNFSNESCSIITIGIKIPANLDVDPTSKLMLANTEEVAWTPTHGPGSLFKLLMGNTSSTRDKLTCAHVLTSLFIMELAPGIDNKPHHHDTEEEIYFVLQGQGEVLTGEGLDGLGGRYPAQAGDAFFFRLNATVGFARSEGGENPRILAVRSLYPFRKQN